MAAACVAGSFPALSRGQEGAAQSGSAAVKVPAASLLMARQEVGETRLDRSFKNGELSIGGKKYAAGIGTHATSMIPLPVPEGSGSRVWKLEGPAALMLTRTETAAWEFRVMSGSKFYGVPA